MMVSRYSTGPGLRWPGACAGPGSHWPGSAACEAPIEVVGRPLHVVGRPPRVARPVWSGHLCTINEQDGAAGVPSAG